MRFNDPQHLEHYKATGQYPKIHAAFTSFVLNYLNYPRIIDLGCGYGLLGHSIIKKYGGEISLGIEGDGAAVSAGIAAGLTDLVEFYPMWVMPEKSSLVATMAHKFNARALVARRSLPEIFGKCDDPTLRMETFALELCTMGVEQIFIEGRVPVANAVNPLNDIQAEVAPFLRWYDLVKLNGAMAYLKRTKL